MTDDNDAAPAEQATPPSTVHFTYLKSNHFRVIHVDGVIGGPGPRNSVFISFFSERLPIPQEQTFQVTPQGTLGKELMDMRVGKQGIVREVETAVVLDIVSAKQLLKWLADKIAEVERLEGELQNDAKEQARSSVEAIQK